MRKSSYVAIGLLMFAVSLSAHADPFVEKKHPPTTAEVEERQRPVAAKATLAAPLPEVRFEEAALDEVISFYRDVTGANLHVNWRAIESAGVKRRAPIKLRERNISLDDALAKTLEQLKPNAHTIAHDSDDEVIYVSTAENLAELRAFKQHQLAKPRDDAARELLGRRIFPARPDDRDSIRFGEAPYRTTVAQALAELSKRTGVTILADNGFAQAGISNDMRVTARLRNVTLETALDVLLSQTGKLPRLDYDVVEGAIVISAVPESGKN